MASLQAIINMFGTLLLMVGLASAKPVKYVGDFDFEAGANRLDCPAAGQTKYIGPHGGQRGILCGWDTKTTTYRWGPINNLSFEQCILECGATEGCTVATYTGTCYLKQSAKNKGYVSKGNQSYRVAVKLN